MRSGCDAFHPLTSLTLLRSTRLQDTQTLHARGTGGFPTSKPVPVLSWQNLPHTSTDRLQPARGWGSFPGLTPSRGSVLLLLLLKSHWLHEHGGLGVFGWDVELNRHNAVSEVGNRALLPGQLLLSKRKHFQGLVLAI